MSRAYQFAAEPESEDRIAPSGRRLESSWKTSCGLIGSAASCPLRQELRVREARADHQERVALLHQSPARPGAEQADRAGHVWKVIGQRRLAQQRLGDAGTEHVGRLGDRGGGVQRALADEHRHLLADVQDGRGPVELMLGRDHPRTLESGAGVDGPVLVRRLRDRVGLL